MRKIFHDLVVVYPVAARLSQRVKTVTLDGSRTTFAEILMRRTWPCSPPKYTVGAPNAL